MKYSRNSLLLTAGLFSIAAAIAFHAWWPSYKADRDLEQYVADCMPIDLLAQKESIRLSDIPESQDGARKGCIKEYYFIHSDRMR